MSAVAPARLLVVAKAPVPGRVKTRLGAGIGLEQAAAVAAASLLDTLRAGAEAFAPDHRHLALAGTLAGAVRGEEIAAALEGWHVHEQRGSGFAERLVQAHLDVAASGGGPVVQVGMDTPQVTPRLLREAAARLDGPDAAGAVLGPAPDGGWWVLVLRDPAAARPLADVVMSTPTTYDDTRRALERAGLRVVSTSTLRDVDTAADARAVAAVAPEGEFARAWAAVAPVG